MIDLKQSHKISRPNTKHYKIFQSDNQSGCGNQLQTVRKTIPMTVAKVLQTITVYLSDKPLISGKPIWCVINIYYQYRKTILHTAKLGCFKQQSMFYGVVCDKQLQAI